ncbi:MAG: pilus assembly protein [Planctomycetes bacterium]|nr:pilus assembly protein [Planctomycetota bacterium]
MTQRQRNQDRKGTTAIETAVVLPVFLFMVFAIIEFGHAQMVNNVLNSACRNGARLGSVEGTSTNQVFNQVDTTLSQVIPTASVAIVVKDASVYDSGGTPPTTETGLSALPDIELSDAESRQLFMIRASVPYNDIALMSMPFMEGVVLTGQSFMRHE